MEAGKKKINRSKSDEPHITGSKSFARISDEEVTLFFLYLVIFKYIDTDGNSDILIFLNVIFCCCRPKRTMVFDHHVGGCTV